MHTFLNIEEENQGMCVKLSWTHERELNLFQTERLVFIYYIINIVIATTTIELQLNERPQNLFVRHSSLETTNIHTTYNKQKSNHFRLDGIKNTVLRSRGYSLLARWSQWRELELSRFAFIRLLLHNT